MSRRSYRSPSRESHRGKIMKGTPFGRILKVRTRDGREEQYHATKGWRSFKA